MSEVEPSDTLDESTAYRDEFMELAQLAGALAHELKNPLSVILLNMDLMRDDLAGVPQPQSREALKRVEIVRKQCVRLENLLNDFLRFTRLGRLELRPGVLNQQVEQVLEFFEAQASQQNVEIVRYLDPDLPSVMMDRPMLQAALINLVKNALEAMPHGGQLVARTRLTRDGVALDLIDTGVGMDDVALMKMFENFYTTKDAGTGLGLPTAKKIIEAHGGWINVLSEPGRGTQFTLQFPTPRRI